MIPDVLTFQADPLPCDALGCFLRRHSILMCRAERCCSRWMRQAAEDRARREDRERRDLADARERLKYGE
jgi:hypothetical protein